MKSSFAKHYDVNAPGRSRNYPNHVSFQSPRESVGSNDMVHNYYLEEAKKKAQLQKDKALNNKPSVQQSARLPNTANGNKLKPKNFNQQPRNWPPSMSSRVSNRTKKDAQSHKTTKRYMPVEKTCDSKKHGRQILIGQKFSLNKSSNVYLKTTPPRSGLTWKPTGRNFTQVGLKWIPIRNLVETRYNTNDSASPLGKKTHNPKTVICVNSSSLSIEDTAYLCLYFTKYHEGLKTNTPYLESTIRRIQGLLSTKILEDIKRGPYSKKSPIHRNALQGVHRTHSTYQKNLNEYHHWIGSSKTTRLDCSSFSSEGINLSYCPENQFGRRDYKKQ
ncbi:hypothetical protein Tco_0669826 [Tanacetum coccineum]